MSTDHNEAMRLADRISPETNWYEFDQVTWCNEAAVLIRKQAERIAELELQPAFAQMTSDLAVKLADTEAERDTLRAEVERLRVDAERYRWLREHSYVEVTCKSPRDPSWTPQHLDTAIDIARKEST